MEGGWEGWMGTVEKGSGGRERVLGDRLVGRVDGLGWGGVGWRGVVGVVAGGKYAVAGWREIYIVAPLLAAASQHHCGRWR